jgi:hypothetical protein
MTSNYSKLDNNYNHMKIVRWASTRTPQIRKENYFKHLKLGAKHTTYLPGTAVLIQNHGVTVEFHIRQDKIDKSTRNNISKHKAGKTCISKHDQPKTLSGHKTVLRHPQ